MSATAGLIRRFEQSDAFATIDHLETCARHGDDGLRKDAGSRTTQLTPVFQPTRNGMGKAVSSRRSGAHAANTQ